MKENKIKLPLISLIVGVAFWLLGELLFNTLTQKMFTPLGVALYFLIFGIILCIVVTACGYFQVDLSNTNNARNTKGSIGVLAILLVLVFLLTGVFEFLYELGGKNDIRPTSYIFLIDDSGSMAGNDRSNVRPSAIEEIMKDSAELPYAVYKFESGATLLKGMGKYAPGDAAQLNFQSYGGTNILGSVRTVLDDLRSGKLTGAGDQPRIILFSDGGSSAFGMRDVAKDCVANGVSICSVGFGGCNASFLKRIANLTGGVYVYCDDASNLAASMKKAASNNLERNLLSARFMMEKDGLYCAMRIGFLSIVGIFWSLMKKLAAQNIKSTMKNGVLVYILLCIGGALIMEFLSRILPVSMVRLMFCLAWAVVLGTLCYAVSTGVQLPITVGGGPGGGDGGPGDFKQLSDDKNNNNDTKRISFSTSADEKPNSGKGLFGGNGGNPGAFGGNHGAFGGNGGNSGAFGGNGGNPGAFGGNRGAFGGNGGNSGAFGGNGGNSGAFGGNNSKKDSN